MNKRYVIVIVILTLLSSFLFIPAGRAGEYGKGHTGLHGRTTQPDSNFVFELSGPYWYENLEIWLETWQNESDYRLYINDQLVDEGTIYEGKTYKNYTLPDNRPVDLVVEIDNYTYYYRQKLITSRDHTDWTPPDKEKDGEFYSPAEITILTAKVLGVSFATFAVATPIAGHIVKKQSEEQVYEVI